MFEHPWKYLKLGGWTMWFDQQVKIMNIFPLVYSEWNSYIFYGWTKWEKLVALSV